MNLAEAMHGRRSIRKYQEKPVPRDLVEKLLGEAMWAPSGKNKQPWHLVVVAGETRDRLSTIIKEAGKHLKEDLQRLFPEKIVNLTLQYFENMGGAPVIILAYMPRMEVTIIPQMSDYERHVHESERMDAIQSVAALLENFALLAYEAGLGTCWMSGPRYVAAEVSQLLGIQDKELVAAMAVGYPNQAPPAPPRREGKIAWIGF